VDQDSLSKFLLAAGSLRYFDFYSYIFIVADPGSEILCLFDPWIWDGNKSGSGIRDEHP
jgi:hypothetical protein